MANWCSVEAEIVCIDGQKAETLYQKLLTDKTEADKRDHGYIFKIHPRNIDMLFQQPIEYIL